MWVLCQQFVQTCKRNYFHLEYSTHTLSMRTFFDSYLCERPSALFLPIDFHRLALFRYIVHIPDVCRKEFNQLSVNFINDRYYHSIILPMLYLTTYRLAFIILTPDHYSLLSWQLSHSPVHWTATFRYRIGSTVLSCPPTRNPSRQPEPSIYSGAHLVRAARVRYWIWCAAK